MVFYNRKGEGRYYRCLDCETAIYCPRCDTLMTVYEDNGVTLVCPQCSNRIKPPYRCEVCQSYRLGTAGLGIDSLAKIINERLPQARVATLGGKQTDLQRDYDILVSTAQLFYLPAAAKFSLIATIQIDQVLHGTDWRTNEEAYLLLSHLAERTDHLVIQTTMPENPVIQAFCGHGINQLYQQEYRARQQHRYPPAYPLLRLIYADTSLDKAQQESQKLHQALVTQLPQLANDIFAPSAIGSGKRRGKYRYQIIIKHRLTAELLKLIPSAWQIDPEPLDLRT